MENSKEQDIENEYKVVLSYIKDFLKTRKFIFAMLLLFFVFGILTVLFTPKVYSSEVTFIAQGSSSSGKTGGLSSIAKILSGAGSSSSGENTDIPTFLYPKIIESLYFKRQLYETSLKIKGIDSSVTFFDYATTIEKAPLKSKILKYTIGLPKVIFGSKKKSLSTNKIDSLEYFSAVESKVILSLKDKISFNIDDEFGTLTIRVTIEGEAIATTQLAQSAQEILQKEIIKYRIAKATEKYDFIEKQYQEKKVAYDQAQARLAAYNDRNLFNTTQSSLIRTRQLENESALFYNVYSDLEAQRLSASIKIQEDTPTFTIINPAVVPFAPNSSNSIKTILIFLMVGFFISIFRYVFIITKRHVKALWSEV